MKDLQIFRNPEFGQVRTVTLNDDPWFVGKDIATALGYAKPENAIANHVDSDDKTSTLIQGSGSNYKSKAIIINESGLYSLILSSKLPAAKKFKHWVTSEVLPALRKTAVKDIGDTADTIAQVFHVKKGIAMTASMQMVGEAYGIDTEPLKKLVPPEANPVFLTPTKIAAELKILTNKGNPNPQRVNSLLKALGLQESVGGHWHATEEGKKLSEAMPYTASSGHSGYQLLWSPKVIPMLRDLLEKGGD